MTRISVIAAIGKNRELGKNNELIWRIPEDLKRVKALTMGHPIIMGRKTYESIGHPLPGRTNIIVTTAQMCIEGCLVFNSFEKALRAAQAIDTEEVFVFGGARVYEEAITVADRLYLTCIDAEEESADVYFPDFSVFTTVLIEEKHLEHTPPFTWRTLERALK